MRDLELNMNKKCLDALMKDSLDYLIKNPFYSKNKHLKDFHVSVLFGDDQAFSKANESFEFISLLMERMNEFSMELYGEQYEMRYSTVDEFLSSLKEMDLDYEVY
jgi:hypothetical protein